MDSPKVVDFGVSIPPSSEVFVGIKPQLTLANREIRDFDLVSDLLYSILELILFTTELNWK